MSQGAIRSGDFASAIMLLAGLVLGACPSSERWTTPEHPERQRGVVVEEVGHGSALEQAGVRAGDVIYAWHRPADPPANLDHARGEIASVFDWTWVGIEQGPRGPLVLAGQRDGEPIFFKLAMGMWAAAVRPKVPERVREEYSLGHKEVAVGDLEGGLRRWRRIGETAEQQAERELACWIYLCVGDAWSEAGEWENAERAYGSALAQAWDPFSRAAVWNALARNEEARKELGKAEESYRRSLRIWENLKPESLSTARSLVDLGNVVLSRGDLEAAAEYYRRVLEIQERWAPGSFDLSKSLAMVGAVARRRGDPGVASEHYHRALAIAEELAPESHHTATVLSYLGDAAAVQGDLEVAEGYFHRALILHEALEPDSLAVAICLRNLGTVAGDRGDLEAATENLERAMAIQERLMPEGLGIAVTLNNLGWLASKRDDLERAWEFHQRALEIRTKLAPESLEITWSLNNLGNVARDRGHLKEAASFLHRALKMAENQAPGSLEAAYSLQSLGEVAQRRGDLEAAFDFFNRAVDIRQKLMPGSLGEAESLDALGVVSRKANRPELAVTYFLRAVDALESGIGKLGGSQNVKGGSRALFRHHYRNAIEALLELNRSNQAFTLLERSRAGSFLALLAERDLLFHTDVPEDLENARQRLTVEYDHVQRQMPSLSPERDKERLKALRQELRKMQRKLEKNAVEILNASPKLAALQYFRPLDLSGAREALDSGTVMLSYSVGQEQTDLFVVMAKEDLEVVTLPVGEEKLRREVNHFRQLIEEARPGNPQLDAVVEVGKRLYATLVEPVARSVAKSERVLIVPDGPLHLLPFSALVRPAPAHRPGGTEQYLAQWKPLHSALSVTVYAELKGSRPPWAPPDGQQATLQLVAFGDPQYPRYLRHTDESVEIADPQLRSAVDRELFDWEPLPHSRREVEEIAQLYPPEAVRIYQGEGATEERVKALSGVDILHFAVHGHIDDRYPLSSALALTIPEDLSPDRDNGLLQVWEIFESVRLDADMVVLSACATALGQEQGGEGLIGLTRAFQYAGARTVVASLWNVNDQITAELMVRFHRYLRAGKPPNEALRAAQLELIREPIRLKDEKGQIEVFDASAPFYWAAFQIVGAWR